MQSLSVKSEPMVDVINIACVKDITDVNSVDVSTQCLLTVTDVLRKMKLTGTELVVTQNRQGRNLIQLMGMGEKDGNGHSEQKKVFHVVVSYKDEF